jgi:hypothetical protein
LQGPYRDPAGTLQGTCRDPELSKKSLAFFQKGKELGKEEERKEKNFTRTPKQTFITVNPQSFRKTLL